MFTSDGSLHAVKLQTYMVGAPYYPARVRQGVAVAELHAHEL